MYTVKEVAKLASVSVRTLHYYDNIALLRPAHVGENGYRYYGEAELLRLQQILFYREFGISLKEIAEFLDQPNFDHVSALRSHRTQLELKINRYRQLIETINHTIERLAGDNAMQNSDLYKGFSPEKQQAHEDWLVNQYGPRITKRINTSKKHLNSMTQDQLDAKMRELAQLENSLVKQMHAGVDARSDVLEGLLKQHQDWISDMWGRPCPPEAYAGLADIYLSHPDFKDRYETIAEGFTAYLVNAMKTYAERCQSL